MMSNEEINARWEKWTKDKMEWDKTHGAGHGRCRKRCPQCNAFCDMKHRNPLAEFHEHRAMPRTHDGRVHHTTDWGPA